MSRFAPAFLCLLLATPAWAGLHYSAETWAELPAAWRGYLLDQRALRVLAMPPGPNQPASVLRDAYQADRDRLEKLTAERPLTADEAADLAALRVRFGEPAMAADLLRAAHRRDPEHFRVAANLGTACQLAGELDQAVAALEIAARLAPPRWKRAEELHLKLVRGRRNEARGASGLDDIFGVTFIGEPTPPTGLPSDAVTLTQTLGLWLPGDARILWQLGELARAAGDTATAAAILEGCVSEMGLNHPELRQHRQAYRAAVDQPASLTKADAASAHAGHSTGASLRFKSTRPLVRKPSQFRLPPVRPDGLNQLPWHVLADTTLDRPFRVAFADHLKQLDGKRVSLTGFLQPTGDGIEQSAVLLIEYPVGCWFCEVPEPTGIVLVEPNGPVRLSREPVRVEGRLKLNSTDPEEFLYTIRDARVAPPD